MASVTYKCPNCGGGLIFNPAKQNFKCEFCDGEFTEAELIQKAKEAENSKEVQDQAAQEDKLAQEKKDAASPASGQEASSGDDFEEHNQVYNCPSCGAQLVMDDTTAATYCYYCSNPVVLAGRLTKDMRPDKVLPFTVTKEKAKEAFLEWARSKKFIPSDFFASDRIDKLTGVYFPYWVADYKVKGRFEGEGKKISTVSRPDADVTTIQHYDVQREGEIEFNDVARPALGKIDKGTEEIDRKLSDGVHPYDLADDKLKDFSMAYLSGFMAEKRDIDSSAVKSDIEKELGGYVKPLLTSDSADEDQSMLSAANTRYDELDGDATSQVESSSYSYCLLPAWTLAYKGADGRMFHYAINGQSGRICGKLPLDKGKLYRLAAAVGAVVCGLLLLGGAFIW